MVLATYLQKFAKWEPLMRVTAQEAIHKFWKHHDLRPTELPTLKQKDMLDSIISRLVKRNAAAELHYAKQRADVNRSFEFHVNKKVKKKNKN